MGPNYWTNILHCQQWVLALQGVNWNAKLCIFNLTKFVSNIKQNCLAFHRMYININISAHIFTTKKAQPCAYFMGYRTLLLMSVGLSVYLPVALFICLFLAVLSPPPPPPPHTHTHTLYTYVFITYVFISYVTFPFQLVIKPTASIVPRRVLVMNVRRTTGSEQKANVSLFAMSKIAQDARNQTSAKNACMASTWRANNAKVFIHIYRWVSARKR